MAVAKSNKFGTFGGVFTPSILTILGVIMYLRLPMIVGQAGLLATIGIIVVAHIISITTGLSVSSIATDKKVRAGGTYYMISRSLGLPIGGTLGLALFVGLSFSVSLYLIGFSESFLSAWGFEVTKNTIRISGTIILLVVTIITFISTSLALKMQYFIMAAIFLSLLSILFGKHDLAPQAPFFSNPSSTVPLMVLFGIFFPAVTGFEAGVSMSGDLKDPKKSIPLGSISAIVVGLVVYIALAFFFSYTVDPESLAKDPQILLKISRIPALVLAGIWGATLSSALGSILGAPRILQATAADKITPRLFAKGTGATNEPRNALILTFFIAEAGILIGELDVIARIVSIFFITTYGFLNLSCAFENMTSADFRPTFRSPVWVSLLGSVAAMLVMIQLDFVAMLGATIILGALYLYLKRKELELKTGDAWSGIWASLVKTGLNKLRTNKLHGRNWRPNILMFCGNESSRPYLVDMGRSISGRLGMLSGFDLVETREELLYKPSDEQERVGAKTDYFSNTHLCHDIFTGMDEIIRVYGYTGLQPNTVLMGWSRDITRKAAFLDFITRLQRNNFNSLFLHQKPAAQIPKNAVIDIWWSGWGSNLSFAINLVRYLTGSEDWKDAKLRLRVIVNDPNIQGKVHHALEKILEAYRIDMDLKVINNAVRKLKRNTIIQQESATSDLIIIGIPDTMFETIDQTYSEVNELVSVLPTSLLINASNTFEAYSLISESRQDSRSILEMQRVPVPELSPSSYSFIASHSKALDQEGMAAITLFSQQTLKPFFLENADLLTGLADLCRTGIEELKAWQSLANKRKQVKLLRTIRSNFFRESGKIIENYIEKKLAPRSEMLGKGMDEYLTGMEALILELPKHLKAKLPREEYLPAQEDSRSVKRLKFRKRFFHPFSKTLQRKIHLRKIVRYYLYENRLQHLAGVLSDILFSDLVFLSGIQQLIRTRISLLDMVKKDLTDGKNPSDNLENALQECDKKIIELDTQLQNDLESVVQKLSLDYRKSVQLLNNDLERLTINKQVSSHRRKGKFYSRLSGELVGYHEVWDEEVRNYANRIYLDSLMLALKEKIATESKAIYLDIAGQIDSSLSKRLTEIKNEIKELEQNKQKNQKIADVTLALQINYLQDLDALKDSAALSLDEIPEAIVISEEIVFDSREMKMQEKASYTIPVRRLTAHYLESSFIAPFQDFLEEISETSRKAVFRLKDHISYIGFEVENLDPEDDDFLDRRKEVIREGLTEIEKEEEGLEVQLKNVPATIDNLLETAFEPLSSHQIIKSSRDISHLIREYQSKKTVTKFEKVSNKIRSFIRSRTVRLLYSTSEGMLLAKKLSEQKETGSVQEGLLELLDSTKPLIHEDRKVPGYYINLFSGKSNIGEDFWISRKTEEKQFGKALKHYQSSHRGAILITGERNSGKSALCRHLARVCFEPEQCIHLFPPLNGSINTQVFERELQKSTGLNGSLKSIFELIRMESVIFIHDLELWWERTDEGMKTIRLIGKIIKEYEHKCLFVINCNTYAYNYMNSLHPLNDLFISAISCNPFDSEDLKELIMCRHRSSGLKFILGRRKEEHLSELRMAAIFNRIFRLSGGNPGMAMKVWLSMIKDFNTDVLRLRMPLIADYTVLERLDDDWLIVLAQVVLHKHLSQEKLQRIMGISPDEVKDLLGFMLMSGILVERSTDQFIIHPYLHRAVVQVLVHNELLK